MVYYTNRKVSKKNKKLVARMQHRSKESMANILEKYAGISPKPGVGSREHDFIAHDIKTERRATWQLRIARSEFAMIKASPEFRKWLEDHKLECYYCNEVLTLKSYVIDHIIPLARWGANDLSNFRISCASCNAHKSDKMWIEDEEPKIE